MSTSSLSQASRSPYVRMGAAVGALLLLFGAQAASQQAPRDEAPAADRSFIRAAWLEGVAPASSAPLADGEDVYNRLCRSCHQADGQGVPGTFPPLNETGWVSGDEGRLIRLLLHGLAGPIEVAGQTYTGAMPPWGGVLSDEEMAQVATYVRANFGNDAAPITAAQVAKVRSATEGRKKPWTAEELKQEANQGIPGDSTGAGE